MARAMIANKGTAPDVSDPRARGVAMGAAILAAKALVAESVSRFQDRAALEAIGAQISWGWCASGATRSARSSPSATSSGWAWRYGWPCRCGWASSMCAPSWELFLILCAAPVIGVATFFQFGLYRLVTRYIGGRGGLLILVAVGLSALLWAFAGAALRRPGGRGRTPPGVQVVPAVRLHPLSDPRRGLRVGDAPGGRLAAQERAASSCPCACARRPRAC